MIKEELRKEIEKEAKRRTQGFRNQENCIQSYIMGATDFVEVEEKKITELNDKLSEQMFECASCEDRFNANHRQYLLSQAKEIMKIGVEAVKHWGIVAGSERPFEKEAEKLFNLFFEKADKFLSEAK